MLNWNNYFGFFFIFLTPLFIIFQLIICGKKSKSNSKLKEAEQNGLTPRNNILSSYVDEKKYQLNNRNLSALNKAKENRQKVEQDYETSDDDEVKNNVNKNIDINNNPYPLKPAQKNYVDPQEMASQDNHCKIKSKYKNESKYLPVDLTQDDSNVDKTISSYISLTSKNTYIHRPPKKNKKSVSIINNISRMARSLSTKTACQKSEKGDNGKNKAISNKKCDNKVKKICENKKIKSTVEGAPNAPSPTNIKLPDIPKPDDEVMKKNKLKNAIQSDYSFGSTVKETNKKKEPKVAKRSYDNTETFPPPTSLQILQHESNFELDDLTERIRMMGETPNLKEAIQIKDDDSILAAIKLKQNTLINKDKDCKTATYSCEKSKENINNTQVKQKEYPKPKKITEVYKNEEILKKMSNNKNN
uniref:Uncharacterized protein n=1 Tax=Strongyloides stercoralis TaxID=6248 RepID=A0A0K0E1M1_STRER